MTREVAYTQYGTAVLNKNHPLLFSKPENPSLNWQQKIHQFIKDLFILDKDIHPQQKMLQAVKSLVRSFSTYANLPKDVELTDLAPILQERKEALVACLLYVRESTQQDFSAVWASPKNYSTSIALLTYAYFLQHVLLSRWTKGSNEEVEKELFEQFSPILAEEMRQYKSFLERQNIHVQVDGRRDLPPIYRPLDVDKLAAKKFLKAEVLLQDFYWEFLASQFLILRVFSELSEEKIFSNLKDVFRPERYEEADLKALVRELMNFAQQNTTTEDFVQFISGGNHLFFQLHPEYLTKEEQKILYATCPGSEPMVFSPSPKILAQEFSQNIRDGLRAAKEYFANGCEYIVTAHDFYRVITEELNNALGCFQQMYKKSQSKERSAEFVADYAQIRQQKDRFYYNAKYYLHQAKTALQSYQDSARYVATAVRGTMDALAKLKALNYLSDEEIKKYSDLVNEAQQYVEKIKLRGNSVIGLDQLVLPPNITAANFTELYQVLVIVQRWVEISSPLPVGPTVADDVSSAMVEATSDRLAQLLKNVKSKENSSEVTVPTEELTEDQDSTKENIAANNQTMQALLTPAGKSGYASKKEGAISPLRRSPLKSRQERVQPASGGGNSVGNGNAQRVLFTEASPAPISKLCPVPAKNGKNLGLLPSL